jgi:hypothetical protein
MRFHVDGVSVDGVPGHVVIDPALFQTILTALQQPEVPGSGAFVAEASAGWATKLRYYSETSDPTSGWHGRARWNHTMQLSRTIPRLLRFFCRERHPGGPST